MLQLFGLYHVPMFYGVHMEVLSHLLSGQMCLNSDASYPVTILLRFVSWFFIILVTRLDVQLVAIIMFVQSFGLFLIRFVFVDSLMS